MQDFEVLLDALLANGYGKPLMFIHWAGNSSKILHAQMTQDTVWLELAGSTFASLESWYAWSNPFFPDRPTRSSSRPSRP